jgi:hypothetical protein
LGVVNKFSCLGDLIEAETGRQVDKDKTQKCKFRELGHILMLKGLSLKVSGRVYNSFVRSTLWYGTETFAVKVD